MFDVSKEQTVTETAEYKNVSRNYEKRMYMH